MIPTEQLSDPTVRSAVTAINAGDRDAFLATFTADATMSDDGSDRDLLQWIDREILSVGGRMEVESQSPDGLSLLALYRNDTWGQMRTSWAFTITGGKVSHMDTGQA